jgi:predicted nucleic acid-binding protein
MELWLVDASVLLACEDTDDRNHADAQRLLTGDVPLATLDLAYYEVTNVATAAWEDAAAARRVRRLVATVAADGGLVRVETSLLDAASELAQAHAISAYDAAYVAAAASVGAQLVSCDVRDLVSRGLARLPSDALSTNPNAPDGD